MKDIEKNREIVGQNILRRPLNQRGVALVVSLLILVMITALGLAGIMASSTEVKLGGNERVGAETLYAADAGIQHALRALRGQDFDIVTASPQPWLNVTNFNGTPGLNYFVDVKKINTNGDIAPANTVFITATATYPSGGGLKRIEAEVRNLSTMVPVTSTLGVVGNDSEIRFEDNVTVNGDLSGGEVPVAGSDCAQNKAAVAVDTVSAYDEIRLDGGGQSITGMGLTPSVQLRPQDMSAAAIQALSSDLATNADRTIAVNDTTAEINTNTTYGTVANPQVTVFNMEGDDSRVRFNGTVTGAGILILNSNIDRKGRIEFGDSFSWDGIIIITGSTRIEFDGTAGTSITGGVIIANTEPDASAEDLRFRVEAATTIQYSCTALTNAMNKAPLSLNAWHQIL